MLPVAQRVRDPPDVLERVAEVRGLPVEHGDDLDGLVASPGFGRPESARSMLPGLKSPCTSATVWAAGSLARSQPSTTSSSGNGSSCWRRSSVSQWSIAAAAGPVPGGGSPRTGPSPAARQSTAWIEASSSSARRANSRPHLERAVAVHDEPVADTGDAVHDHGRSLQERPVRVDPARARRGTGARLERAEHGELLAAVGDEDAPDRVASHDQLGPLDPTPVGAACRQVASNGQFSRREPRRRAAAGP